jgi:hypothetical protein
MPTHANSFYGTNYTHFLFRLINYENDGAIIPLSNLNILILDGFAGLLLQRVVYIIRQLPNFGV